MPFSHFRLSAPIVKAIQNAGYLHPTSIQESVIPLVFEGKDILALAQTGTGKTASFVLPVLEHWGTHKKEGKAKIKILILTPTRELCLQIASACATFSLFLPKKPKIVSLIGGESISEQLYDIQQGCDIVVATSGRLVDIIKKKQINLGMLEFFILDEADKMLDLGFAQELDTILEQIPQKRQNLLFSATYPHKMALIASRITQDPVQIDMTPEAPIIDALSQRVIHVDRENRAPLLRHLLKTEDLKQVLVFMANKRATDNIAAKFRKYGFNAESFHSDLSQEERNATLEDFKNKKIHILFTTDLISRGVHIEGIDCVVNFDLPRSPDDYIHRIGRTARAGKAGLAFSFVAHEDEAHFRIIEKRAKIRLTREQIEGFVLTKEIPKKEKGSQPIKGKKKSKKDKLREQTKTQQSDT